jgi:RNA recognition motif-containing protein
MEIYVGNVPSSLTSTDLKKLFKGYDKLATFAVKRMKGKLGPVTYGLVVIPSDRTGKKAIKRLHMKRYMGKIVIVREFSYRASSNDRRQLGWRKKMWLGEERRNLDRRDPKIESKKDFEDYAA